MSLKSNFLVDDRDGSESYVGMGIFVESTALTKINSNLLTYNYVKDGSSTNSSFKVTFGNALCRRVEYPTQERVNLEVNFPMMLD